MIILFKQARIRLMNSPVLRENTQLRKSCQFNLHCALHILDYIHEPCLLRS